MRELSVSVPVRPGLLPYVLALACAAAVPAARAGDEVPAAARLPLEELMSMKMVKAASKFEQLVTEAPAAATVLTSADIQDHGWRSLGQALASLPGLWVTSDRNYTYLGARGFLRPGDYNSRFLLTIDGVRTNDALYDQAMLGNDALVDMDMVQRIEFIPGAGSAVYGSSALFGVINVVTRDGSVLAGPRVAASAGSQGERRLRASHGWHGQGGADVLMSASVVTRHGEDLDFGGAVPNPTTPGRDGEQARQFLLKASYAGLTVSANHVHRTKQLPTGAYGTLVDAPNRTMDAQTVARLGYVRDLAADLALSVQASWGRSEYLGHYYYPNPQGQAAPNVDGGHGRWYGLGVQATSTRFAGHRIVAGADIGRDARRDQFNVATDPYRVALDDHRASNRRGVFVEDELHLGERVLVNASLRFDQHSTGAHTRSPRLAFLYRIAGSSTLKLIHGKAFRVPNAYEMYYQVDGEGGQLANLDLTPERISTTEAVLEHGFGIGGHARLSVFTYRMRDVIAQEEDLASGMLVFRNDDRAHANGVEMSVEQAYANAARVRASYTWQRATDGQGQSLPASARHLLKFNGAMPLAVLDARLGGELQCMSSRLAAHSRVAGYCVTNVHLSSSALVKGAEVSVGVFNLADRRYLDPAGPVFVQEALPREGRSAFVKLVYGF